MTYAGLNLSGKILLGIAPQEPLALFLFTNSSGIGPATPFGDYTPSTLPGAGVVALDHTLWFDASLPDKGDFVYPIIPFTIGSSSGGETLYGYLVYAVTSSTPLWVHLFDIPQVIPPTGGAAFINMEFTDRNFVP
jgi:hypothetical protein